MPQAGQKPNPNPNRKQLSLFDAVCDALSPFVPFVPFVPFMPFVPVALSGQVPAITPLAPKAPPEPSNTSAAPPVRPPSATPPAVPGVATASARFQHPRAQRSVTLDGHAVGYEFRRARRRSIGFVVGIEGLSVSAPRWVALGEVDQALQVKAGWILRKLHEQHERAQRLQASKIDWRDGTTLPYLGETVILLLDPRVTGAQLNQGGDALPGVPRWTLHLGLPQGASQDQIREAVQSWLQRQARKLFEERCAHFAAQLGVRVRRLSLSSATTRWGSASANGAVRLNWRLIHFALPVIDYVVAHELAHLREMNHSPAFWEVVRSVLPDYERSRGALRTEVLPAFE